MQSPGHRGMGVDAAIDAPVGTNVASVTKGCTLCNFEKKEDVAV
jgi:hypothetical protein